VITYHKHAKNSPRRFCISCELGFLYHNMGVVCDDDDDDDDDGGGDDDDDDGWLQLLWVVFIRVVVLIVIVFCGTDGSSAHKTLCSFFP